MAYSSRLKLCRIRSMIVLVLAYSKRLRWSWIHRRNLWISYLTTTRISSLKAFLRQHLQPTEIYSRKGDLAVFQRPHSKMGRTHQRNLVFNPRMHGLISYHQWTTSDPRWIILSRCRLISKTRTLQMMNFRRSMELTRSLMMIKTLMIIKQTFSRNKNLRPSMSPKRKSANTQIWSRSTTCLFNYAQIAKIKLQRRWLSRSSLWCGNYHWMNQWSRILLLRVAVLSQQTPA